MLKRILRVLVDDIEIVDVSINAQIIKSVVESEPDYCEITILNLSYNTRQRVVEAKKVAVYAGFYQEGSENQGELCYVGDIQDVAHVKNGVEWSTSIISGDGMEVKRQSIINKTFEEGMKISDLISDITQASGLSAEPVEFIGDMAGIKDLGVIGQTLTGEVNQVIDNICESNDLQWAMQGGKVVVSQKVAARDALAYEISVATGMIGTPDWSNKGKNNATSTPVLKDMRLQVQSIAIPSMRPCDQVRVTSGYFDSNISGVNFKKVGNETSALFKVQKLTHALSNLEGNFMTTMEVSPIA